MVEHKRRYGRYRGYGTFRTSFPHFNGRNVAEFIRQVKTFQHVRSTGEAIPTGWQPGKATLKPAPDLVGKVWKVWKPEKAF
jgi:alkyl hydroperoxide reductase subunit AhpC